MENDLLKRLIAIIARFDQGLTDAEGGEGIDKPAIREAKLILSSDDNTSFVYDLNQTMQQRLLVNFPFLKKEKMKLLLRFPFQVLFKKVRFKV